MNPTLPQRHPIDPLIRLTLLTLYLALVLPLPLLAPASLRTGLLVAVLLGSALVIALTSETVELDEDGIRVGHPRWCRWLLRRGWSLPWSRVRGLTPVATSQGGRVFYIRSGGDGAGSEARAWLLPQRVAEFDRFLELFSRMSGVPTGDVGRLTPAWTYRLLAFLSSVMLLGEIAVLLFHRW